MEYINITPDRSLRVKEIDSAYTIQSSDINTQFRVTGTTTITLPDGLNMSKSNAIEIVNVGADTVTLTLGAGTTINGVGTDITYAAYEGIVIMRLNDNAYLGTGKTS